MATADAIHCIGCAKDILKSYRETEESLCPIPLATQQALSEEVSLQEATAEISLQPIPAIKGAREEHSKGSFHTPLEGWQKHPSQQGKT